jgi:hypothetical protein
MKINLILIFMAFAFTCQGQIKRSKKLDKAIDALNQTEFIKMYKTYKDNVETTIRDFKAEAYVLDAMDVEMVKDSYEQSKLEFDAVAESLKSDLIDKKTREFISNDPDRYTKFIAVEVEKANEHFLHNTASLIDDLTGYKYSGFGVAEINLIIGLVGEMAEMVSSIKSNMKKMTSEYFELYFIKDLRLSKWEDL